MADPPPLGSSEYIYQMREKAVKELRQYGRHRGNSGDIELSIRSIRAILATNEEIFDRVIEHLKYDSVHGSVFWRVGFEVVRVQQIQSKVHFITHPESSDMTFDLTPLKLAPGALGVLQPIYRCDVESIIDYESFFERSLGLLHNDALVPFLLRLKDHLELIQVCLGEVDDWLLDAQSNNDFLKTTFGVDLETCHDGNIEVYMSLTGDAYAAGDGRCLANESCMNCKTPFTWHTLAFINGYYYRQCSCQPQNSNGDAMRTFYCYPTHKVLKECDAVGGKFEAVFNLDNEQSKARLMKLLEFMSC